MRVRGRKEDEVILREVWVRGTVRVRFEATTAQWQKALAECLLFLHEECARVVASFSSAFAGVV